MNSGGPHDLTLSVPRLFFGYATGGNLLFPLSVGGTSILAPEWPTAEGIFNQVKCHRPTILINTPAMIAKMLDWAEQHPNECDLSSIRLMTSAGEKLPSSIYDRWVRIFPNTPLCDGLGFAEHWYFVSVNRPGEIRPGTVGRIIPSLDVMICDEEGKQLSDGEEGAASFRDGWFVPGDLAKLVPDIDGHRRLVYVGRSGSYFKVSGRWVNADEVTDTLLQHSAVAECTVLPYEDQGGLTKPAAFVVLRPDHQVDEDTLKTYVLTKLEGYKCPQRVIFLAELPRTPLGKVDLAALKRQLKEIPTTQPAVDEHEDGLGIDIDETSS
ncbi:MAG: AMP-binding protein [Deltaproteobacteria bacterium]|nr:AMP-binding protein [Deltaproteobacteria bacterium]